MNATSRSISECFDTFLTVDSKVIQTWHKSHGGAPPIGVKAPSLIQSPLICTTWQPDLPWRLYSWKFTEILSVAFPSGWSELVDSVAVCWLFVFVLSWVFHPVLHHLVPHTCFMQQFQCNCILFTNCSIVSGVKIHVKFHVVGCHFVWICETSHWNVHPAK